MAISRTASRRIQRQKMGEGVFRQIQNRKMDRGRARRVKLEVVKLEQMLANKVFAINVPKVHGFVSVRKMYDRAQVTFQRLIGSSRSQTATA